MNTNRLFLLLSLSLFTRNIFANQENLKFNKSESRLEVSGGVNCLWYYNGQLMEGVTDNEILVMADGIYRVEYRDNEGREHSYNFSLDDKTDQPVKIFVIGDSTASEYDKSRYPRTGWAQVLQSYFNANSVIVEDKALSGRSSKSFFTDENGWPVVLPELKKGDFLFIQFGHNDEKPDEKRHTDPYTSYKDYLSVYIDSARAHGAFPVLLTSIRRNSWDSTKMKIVDTHGDYPAAMRELAIEKNVPLIDLCSATKQLFESLGDEYTTNQIFMNLPVKTWENYPEGNSDNTHLQEKGALAIVKLVIESIQKADTIPQFKILRESIQEK